MMTTDIVNEVAHLMRQRDLSLKDPKEVKQIKAQTADSTPQDEVTLTAEGASYANPVSTSPEFEKDQHMKVERLKALVNSGNYKIDHQVVETIAERITKMFL